MKNHTQCIFVAVVVVVLHKTSTKRQWSADNATHGTN